MQDIDKEIEATLLNDPIKVMIVDNSAIIRGFVSKMIAEDSKLLLVSSVQSAKFALDALATKDVDVIVLDIEIEGISGIEALPLILKKKPGVQVIITSSLTTSSPTVSMQALSLGAVDYVSKPSSRGIIGNSEFKGELLNKIKSWGLAKRKGINITASEVKGNSSSFLSNPQTPIKLTTKINYDFTAEVIAIGSSTGGPQALSTVLGGLKDSNVSQPIFITQHIPPTFTKTLAEHLEKASGKKCFEGADGMIVENNCVYIAPGGYHMTIERKEEKDIIKIIDSPAENFCKPSVEPMVRSLLKIYKGNILEIILTGMGNDGHKTAKDVVEAGGKLIAQDEATSVVWGMPGAVASAGLCAQVLPLNDIASSIKKIAARR